MSVETSSIACPECGTRNRASSMFCAECGAMLPHPDADAQTTTSFTPVTGPDDPKDARWDENSAQTTQVFTADTDIDQSIPGNGWAPAPMAPPPDPGRRGFVLGVFATILILLVFGFYLWATVAGEGFRNSITGVF